VKLFVADVCVMILSKFVFVDDGKSASDSTTYEALGDGNLYCFDARTVDAESLAFKIPDVTFVRVTASCDVSL